MEERPLKITEFIGPLSMCINTLDDQYEEFKVFTDFVTGDASRRKAIAATLTRDAANNDPKKQKGKKKKR